MDGRYFIIEEFLKELSFTKPSAAEDALFLNNKFVYGSLETSGAG